MPGRQGRRERLVPLADIKAARAAIREAERAAGTLGRYKSAWWAKNARAEASRRACRDWRA
jgi:hypothetical protein